MKNKLLIAALAVGLVLRLLALNNTIAFDEFVQTRAVLEANEYGLDKSTEMNPLTTWTRLLVTGFLGVSVWSLRLTSLVFAALTAWVLFLLAKELFDKKTALWAVGLLSLSSWHALVSTSISFDGAFLAFYTILALFCFVKHEKTRQKEWLVFCGIAFGLCVLTKYTGVLVFFALLLYAFARNTKIDKVFREFALIGFFGMLTFSVFPLIAFFFSEPSYFWVTLRHGTDYFGGRTISVPLLLIQYALALSWTGPLLFFGYFLSLKNFEKKDLLAHSLVVVVFLFYTFVVQDPFRPVERYFTVFLPMLCLMSGKYFASLNFTRKHWKLFGLVFIVTVTLNFLLNALPGKLIPFYPKTNFFNAVFSLDWNFFVPLTGDQGPVGLYVKFLIFAIAFLVSTVLFVLALKNKKTVPVLLLAVGLGLSVFLMTELAVQPTSPSIGKAVKETASFVKTSQLSGPFYTFRDYAMQYYLDPEANYGAAQERNIDFGDDPERVEKMIKGGTLVVIDFPMLDKQGKLWKVFSKCDEKAIVEDKGVVLGRVFAC